MQRLLKLMAALMFCGSAVGLAGGCGSGKGYSESCFMAADCGSPGGAVCINGSCRTFTDADGYGSLNVNLSFGRDQYQVAASCYLWVILPQEADSKTIVCSDVLAGRIDLKSDTINVLQSEPRYLELQWSSGGTFFPDNLDQFIRPASGAMLVAQGFQGHQGQGLFSAVGCTEGLDVVRDQVVESTVAFQAP